MNHSVHWLMGILTLASIQPLKNSSRASVSSTEALVAPDVAVTSDSGALTPPPSPGYQALADDILPGEAALVSVVLVPELMKSAALESELADLQGRYDALEAERDALLAELDARPPKLQATAKSVPVAYYSSSACYGNNCNTGRRRLFGRR